VSAKISSDYDLSSGIQSVLPFERVSLPGKAGVAPTDVQQSGLMTQLYAAKNHSSAIDAFLRPSIVNLENLSPAAHRQNLRACLEEIQDSDEPGVRELAAFLREDKENSALLEAFYGLLIGGSMPHVEV
jgi:uncharacterized protein (DUF885 family)